MAERETGPASKGSIPLILADQPSPLPKVGKQDRVGKAEGMKSGSRSPLWETDPRQRQPGMVSGVQLSAQSRGRD